jgi:hypothetical protein
MDAVINERHLGLAFGDVGRFGMPQDGVDVIGDIFFGRSVFQRVFGG